MLIHIARGPGFDSTLRPYLVANVIFKLKMHEDCFLLGGVNVTASGLVYDGCPNSERLGFNSPLRPRIFSDCVTYLTHCYNIFLEFVLWLIKDRSFAPT